MVIDMSHRICAFFVVFVDRTHKVIGRVLAWGVVWNTVGAAKEDIIASTHAIGRWRSRVDVVVCVAAAGVEWGQLLLHTIEALWTWRDTIVACW